MREFSCPLPAVNDETITMAHGGGGHAMQRLLEGIFFPAFDNPWLAQRHDAATLAPHAGRLAFTTDSFVVQPLFFPGGDIGSLAVCGTANDLAMAGAAPVYLSAAFILEEGLPVETLRRVAASMRVAADAVGMAVVTGDTKVIEHAERGQLFITTAGVGLIDHDLALGPCHVQPGDAILVSGDVGMHGAALLTARAEMSFASKLTSDCGHVWPAVRALFDARLGVHVLRDCTRGGLAAALVEIAHAGGVNMRIEEDAVPVREGIHGACELLGLDPLQMPCEGRFVAFVPEQDADAALELLAAHALPDAEPPALIGVVTEDATHREGRVHRAGPFGTLRILDVPDGEQLPRIC